MEFSESIFKRRIASVLPASANRPAPLDREGGAGSAAEAAIDVGDLCRIRDDEEFVQKAYRRIIGRECDVSGFVNHIELLRSHVARRIILLQLINSEEARRRGVQFVGIPESTSPRDQRRAPFRSFRGVARGLLARVYEVVRRVWYAPFNSLDHKLSLVLREVAMRADRLSAKTDETLWTLSEKLDAYVGDLQQRTHQLRDQIGSQHARTEEIGHSVAQSLQLMPAKLEEGTTILREGLLDLRTRIEAQEAQSARTSEIFRQEINSRLALMESNHKALLDQLDAFSVLTARELAETKRRSHPPVLNAGNNVLVTEVDGFIVGIPGEEWRLAAYYAFRGVPEPGVTRRFLSLIKPGMVVVDIGANIGIYTLYAARLLGQQGKVYSFEPTPRTFEILKDNIQVNGLLELGLIELRQAAVSDTVGTAQLAVFADNCGHNTLFFEREKVQQVTVSTVTLDEALGGETRVDVVKIDAEGAEPFIIRGMHKILNRNPGIRILLEFAPTHLRRAGVDPHDFLEEMSSLGFGIHRIHDVTGELNDSFGPELTEVFSANLELVRNTPGSGGFV
jgi:FkbM family methyltransferase